MPPSTLQARIKAFEALDGVAIHTEPEHLLDRPHSPSAASIPPIVPTTYSPSATSLLDLKDWVIDDGHLGSSPPAAILSGYSPLQAATPLPHERSPPKLVSLSFNSPRSVSAPAASPTATSTFQSNNNMLMPPATDPLTLTDLSPSDGIRRIQGHMHASSVSSFHSVSLSSDGDDFTTPGALHAFPMEREWTGTGTEDSESLDESFENISAPSSFLSSSFLSSTTLTPRQPPLSSGKPALGLATKQSPPPPPSSQPPSYPSQFLHLPPKYTPCTTPTAPSAAAAAVAIPTTNAPRPRSRPPSARTSVQSTATTTSDRSSLFSQGTTTSRTSISSRASVSASASTPTSAPGAKQQAQTTRARYDALFTANVRSHTPKLSPRPTPMPAKRQNAGWRGLSIDVPPPPPLPISASSSPTPPGSALTEKELGPDARLDGRLVREIWLKSRLGPQRLRGIWSECDPDGTGSLDRDAFVRGMSRIDEELRRAQVLGRARAGSSASPRAPPVPSRPILR
ncbi:hypothetical protein BJV77DRAFT_997098 [Russula vinacea]|nr:hypothetical protein BJV77DRAFT_997098 [Russula vinacea]